MNSKTIQMGEVKVGAGFPVFMVAEIGINHNGDIQAAKKLIDAAFACNWHCVKFQKRYPDVCVPEHQKNQLRDTPWGKITYLEYRYKVEFCEPEYQQIDAYCKEKPIAWTASVWDVPSLKFILGYDVPFIKIPSAKIVDHELLKQAADSGKPVVLSTGMSELSEIDAAVALMERHCPDNFVLMHTNSVYPTPTEDLNLNMINTLQKRYSCIVGYSGHEYDLEPSVIAASLGAAIIERHVTLDHNEWGSDHFASLEVNAMDMLCKRIKNIHAMLGDGIKRISRDEQEVMKKLRG